MNRKRARFSALALGLVIVCSPIFAHHGTAASYDPKKEVTLKGTVTEFEWKNPHSQIYLDVKDETGKVVSWAVECNSPGMLKAAGWTRTKLKAGDQVTITVNPSKAGTNVGEIVKIEFPDGTQYARGGGGQAN